MDDGWMCVGVCVCDDVMSDVCVVCDDDDDDMM